MENIPRIYNIWLLKQIQEFMKEQQCDPRAVQRQDHLYVNVQRHCIGRTRNMKINVKVMLTKLQITPAKFPRGHGPFLGPGSEKKWYGTYSDKPDGICDKTAEKIMIDFSETAHPIFRAFGALERGELRSKGGSKKTIHFISREQNVELILRTVMSANQLSIYGSEADICTEYPKIPWLRFCLPSRPP